MITASHNTFDDNGVKIIEPDGSMLVQRWESLAELIVNHTDISELIKGLGEATVK
jgi:phosphoacetylglucosamine mutase